MSRYVVIKEIVVLSTFFVFCSHGSPVLKCLCQNHLEDFELTGLDPTQSFQFCSSGVGPDNLHFKQVPCDADAF